MTFEMVKIDTSSQVLEAGFAPIPGAGIDGIVRIRYRGTPGQPHPLYEYAPVPRLWWEDFLAAKSKGGFVAATFKADPIRYRCQRVQEEPAPVRVIFLDVDGVLNCAATYGRKVDGLSLDLDKIGLLRRLVDETDARIVVSSTWRLGKMTELVGTLHRHGIDRRRVIGRTPAHAVWNESGVTGSLHRGGEIADWLKTTEAKVGAFVILDDGADMGDLLHRLVQTTWQNGLGVEHVERAIAMLRGEEVPDGRA